MNMNKMKLYVSECYADEAKKLRRVTPRAKGRYVSFASLSSAYLHRKQCVQTRQSVASHHVAKALSHVGVQGIQDLEACVASDHQGKGAAVIV